MGEFKMSKTTRMGARMKQYKNDTKKLFKFANMKVKTICGSFIEMPS